MVEWEALLEAAPPIKLTGALQRLVENQEQIATNQLVGSLARQAILEEMLESSKPPLPHAAQRLHYLLATPFRYPPLKHGSRFGKRTEPSLLYGAIETRTVLAEAAYYRFVFWYGMVTPPCAKVDTQHTLFGARYQAARGVRLQNPPFIVYQQTLTHRWQYNASQGLGAQMRAAGIEAFEYRSARDQGPGINVALFTPKALAARRPTFQEPWLCELTAEHVRFQAVHQKDQYHFALAGFQVGDQPPWSS